MNYQYLFERNPNPCWIYDIYTLRFLAVNRAATLKYGYSKEEFLSKTIIDIRPQEHETALLERVKSLDTNTINNEIWQHQTKDGCVFYVRVLSQELVFDNKKARLITAIDIDSKIKTEQHNIELNQQLQQQKLQLEQILSSIHEVIWSCDGSNFQITYISQSSREMFAYVPRQLVGALGILTENVLPEDITEILTSLPALFETGHAIFKCRTTSDGETLKHIYHQCSVLRDEQANIVTINGVSKDITEQEQAKEKANKYAQTIEDILESMTDSFFAVDKEWQFTYINKQCEQLYPFKSAECIGKSFWETFPAALELKFNTYLRKAMTEHVEVAFEEFTPTLGVWLSVKAYPTKEGLAVSLQNISEKKRLQDHLRLEKQNLAALINNTTDIIWSVDQNLRLISYNTGYAWFIKSWCGAEPKPGDYTASYATTDGEIMEWQAFYKRALNGENFKIELLVPVNNSQIFIDARFHPIEDLDGSIIGVSCNCRDITEYKKQLLQVQEQNKQLREIAWIQSHKVRGPLASILGLLKVFNTEDLSDPDNLLVLEKIEMAATALDNVISEVVHSAQGTKTDFD